MNTSSIEETTKMSRRCFVGAMTAGAMGLIAVNPLAAAALDERYAPSFPRSKIRVRKIYLAKPVPTWPTPKLDVPAEIRHLEAELEKLQPDLPDFEFIGGELYRRIEDLGDNVAGRIGDVDAVLVFNLTSTVATMLRAVAQAGVPTILYSQPYSGHDWSTVATLQNEGAKIICLATSNYHEIADALRPIRAIHRMKESRVVYLRRSPVSQAVCDVALKNLGTQIVAIDGARMMGAYEAVEAKLAGEIATRWIRGAKAMVEPTRDEIVRSAKLYLAMSRVLAEEKAQAIAVDCLGMFAQRKLPAYPCLGFTQLNNDLFVGACEADLDSTLTMLLFRYLAEKPGFISDPVIDTSKNQVIHAHCVAPTKMDGPKGELAPYVIRSHMEDDKGAALQVTMRVGQTITMSKLVGSELILVSTGKITDTPVCERGCRTKVTTEVANARKVLEGYQHGLHRVIFYGDHTLDLKRLCYFNPSLRLVEEG